MIRLLFFVISLLILSQTNGALVNVAVGKKTAQSSLFNLGYAYRAVDGCYETHYFAANCGCTETNYEPDPWWSVNMGLMSTVHKVQLTNRGDCCGDRLADFDLWVMSDNMDPSLSQNKVLCAHKNGAVAQGASETIYCNNPVSGVYLSLEIPGGNERITLCEVEVWAEEQSHWGTIFNYATFRTVHMTDDVSRDYVDYSVSALTVDNDQATCPDRMVAGTTNGKFTVDLTHDVAVKKVRVYQSSSCEYYCSTRIEIQGWGYEDAIEGCNSGGDNCWVRNAGPDYIKLNGTDTNNGYDTSTRGWNIVVLDECGCTIKDRIQIDHFGNDQQSGCMTNANGFTPYIQSLDDGDIIMAVSEDEVQRGLANCYYQGLDLLNVRRDDYGYRAAVAFIAKKGFPEFTQRVMQQRTLGPVSITGVYVGSAPLHSFTAGTTTSALASSHAQSCGTYSGLVGRGDIAVLECDASDLPVGRYFQLDFPAVGVHFCEIEIYLGNMAEFCESSGDKCFYIPSRRWGTAAEGEWECRTQYAQSKLAEVDTSEWQLAQSQMNSNSDLDNVNLMSGIVSSSGSWRYYESNGVAPSAITSGQSTSNNIIYMTTSGSTSSMSNNALSLYPLCEISKTLYEGTKHVVMRVPAFSDDLPSSMHTMWTGSSATPNMDSQAAANLVSYDVSVDTVFKSPIVDCAWDFVREVRISLFKRDVEVAFLNFKNPSTASKTDFFSHANLVGSTWVDMKSYTPSSCSINGYTGSSSRRRWLFEKSSDGCGGGTEHAWFMVLDTDHNSCSSWDSDSGLPKFVYSDSIENHFESGADLATADLFITQVTMDSNAFGGSCVSNCGGVPDGTYHSCIGCNVYVTCSGGSLTYGVCMAGMKWHATSLGSGSCSHVSYSCTDRDAPSSCNPNGCSSSPCQNGATCSMASSGGWQCSCVAGWEGSDCSTETDECAEQPCQNGGTCTDRLNGYTCTCAPGYEGGDCQTNTNECASNPCQNRGTCNDQVNSYSCLCVPGYEGANCQTNTNECASTPCQNEGTCNDGVNSYTCTCASGWQDTHCETDTDECVSNPCQHGGSCRDHVNRYTCDCASGYNGVNCQTDINECASNPCQNGGTCTDQVNGYVCTCASGWSGYECEIDINECNSEPCQNSGTCTDHVNGYTCACLPGYNGAECHININECSSSPCQNGATCNDGVNGYTCSCVPGYQDVHCTFNIDECASGPCQNEGTCNDEVNGYTCSCHIAWHGVHCEIDTDECASSPCNDGSCTDHVNGYTCTCEAGFTGTYCETNINECVSTPCQNGATCIDGRNSYTCSCAPGFLGTYCEVDIDECESDPCLNGGSCVDGNNGYICNCVAGYTDPHCETNFDECESNPCVNGATCVDHLNYYTCVCVAGYTGVHCATDIDECASNPCENGGNCTNNLNGFTCVCPEDTMGIVCMSDPCDPNPCMYEGTCAINTSNPLDYTADCTRCVSGFSGPYCEVGPCEENEDACQNGGTCTNAVDGSGDDATATYECDCSGTGYRGSDCSNEANAGKTAHQTSDNGGVAEMMAQYPYAVAGIAAAIVALALLAFFLVARRRLQKKKEEEERRRREEEEEQERQAQMQRNTTFTRIGQTPRPGQGPGGSGPAPVSQKQAWNRNMEEFLDY